MEPISARDRDILRRRAQLQCDYASAPQNDIILEKWRAQAEGRRAAPPIRLLFSNFRHEVITPRLQCEGTQARRIESSLLSTLVGRELFDDDTPITPTFDIGWHTHVRPFGIAAKITRADGPNPQGFHIDPVIDDLAEQLDQLRGGHFGVDRG